MLTLSDITALRMERQFLSNPSNKDTYDSLFANMSPVPTIYWCEPGSPPTLPMHTAFDDYAYNSTRRARRDILKGRFAGGSIAYVTKEDLELYACLYKKELTSFSFIQSEIMDLLTHEGPMNIGLMKETTGLLVKEITPALHKLQEAFLVYEDQLDNEGDRGWYLFESEFSEVDLNRYTKIEALELAIPRFAHLCVFFEEGMIKSYYKLPLKLVNEVITNLISNNVLQAVTVEGISGYVLCEDYESLNYGGATSMKPSILLLQRNDFLVKAYADELKLTFTSQWDTLYYLLIDGTFHGAVTGRFKFGPYIIEDIVLDLQEKDKNMRKEEIIKAVYGVFDSHESPIKRYNNNDV